MAEESSHRGSPFKAGQLTYLQLPALDVSASAVFYAAVFGWEVDPPNAGFDAPGIFGQWITDRPAAGAAGPVLWINVDSIDAALEAVKLNGGQALTPVTPDGPRWLVSIHDPAGNEIGMVQVGPR